MVHDTQAGQLTAESQPDLFGSEPVPAYRPDPEKVRTRLRRILSEARAVQTLPWEPARVSLYRTIVPKMTLWLTEDEGAELRFAFEVDDASGCGARKKTRYEVSDKTTDFG